jgi:chemosensory pili system protein ChpA (sensor histidine kinase/response regulator)
MAEVIRIAQPSTNDGTPIIVMTARAGDKHRQMALNIGRNHIAKPVEGGALIRN